MPDAALQPASPPTLHLMCGKIAAGKSTLAARLATAPGTVLLSEDRLMVRLYPGEVRTIDDYATRVVRLRDAIGPHVTALLALGVTVVLDFQGNTRLARDWMRGLAAGTDARAVLHHLDVPDAVCKARLRARNAAGTHEYQASDDEFDLFTRYFVPPTRDEGFELVVHRPDAG